MRNLKLLKKNYFNFPSNISSSCSSNGYEDGVICLTNDSIALYNGHDLKTIVSDLSTPFENIQNGMSLYCSLANSITSYDNFDGIQLNTITFDEKIIGFSLSPDMAILMVLTSDLNFTILSNELEILTTFSLEQTGLGTAAPQTIGWGKKETQFHGKIGKDARNMIEKIGEISTYDLNKFIMSWKDDGDYFAISYVSDATNENESKTTTRMIKIFSKDGDLYSTSEPTNVLENGLYWRTKSNLITVSYRSNKGLEIVFFEQNGLRHGGFLLYDQSKCEHKAVSSLTFNSNDDICAVAIRDSVKNITQVELFTTDNYHWYKKQTLTVNSLENISMFWSMDTVHIVSGDGSIETYQWYGEVDRSMVAHYSGSNKLFKSPNFVAVIDGDKLMMTPFQICVVPPPYCAFTINFNTDISFVSLPNINEIGDEGLSCVVQTSDKNTYWLRLMTKCDDSNRKTMPTTLKFGTARGLYVAVVEAVQEMEQYLNSINWIDNNSCYCIVDNALYLFKLINDTILQEQIFTEDIIVGKVCHKNQLYIQDTSGEMYRMDDHGLQSMFKHSTFCSEIYCMKMQSEVDDVIISFSSVLNQIFINGCLQTKSYLSILPVNNHLILTSSNQKLRCVNLLENSVASLVDSLDEKSSKTQFDFDETFRLIEPGTKIITCVASDSKIVLMMPRGNLETIFPRALVLDDLKLLMDKGEYSMAIEKMRRQRVNLNLLYDHSPQQFFDNVDKLVRDNACNDRMVLFLSELASEDVTETMYKRFYAGSNRSKGHNSQDKINRICTTVSKLVEAEVNDKFLNLILTCYVKMSPSASDKALQLLSSFKDSGNQKIWDKGLKYLQYLISIDDLYRVALSTYDLKLTLQVAQKTQLDPKEYVSFINDLDELPCEHYRRFKINIFLKKPSMALEFIAKVSDTHWDETVELIKKHSLYVKALELFPLRSTEHSKISAMFAEHLINKSNDLKSAGMVYLRTNDAQLCQLAANCFMKSLQWKEWIIAAKKSAMSDEEFLSNLSTLSSRLRDIGRFSDAMFISETYLKDDQTAFQIALEGRLFVDALRIVQCFQCDDADECTKQMEVSIQKCHDNFIMQLQDSHKKFHQNLNRLIEVRTNFIDKFHEMALTGEDEILHDFMSDTSGATSISSKSSVNSKISNFSTALSKRQSKKSKVKKQWTDKQGSQKEEVGIMENLYFNVKNIQNLILDINGLTDILCYSGYVANAIALINATNELLAFQSKSLLLVWDDFLLNSNFELSEDEVQISNHIKVSRGPKYTGRRRYLFDEPFLRSSPQMSVFGIANVISGM